MAELPDSSTLNHLFGAIGGGKLHVSEAEGLARATIEDGFQSESVAALASLGNWGKHPQNEDRFSNNPKT